MAYIRGEGRNQGTLFPVALMTLFQPITFAARRAFGSFLETRTLSVNQIKFVEIIIDHLSRAALSE